MRAFRLVVSGILLPIASGSVLGAGGPACVNDPPFPDCSSVSPWVTLDAGFGSGATLTVKVDASNGNIRISFVAGGAFPYGKQLTFWHNSRDSRTYPCGTGRNHLYNVMLLVYPNEWPPVPVRIVLANGYRVDFDRNLDGTYRGAPGVFSRLYRDIDGSFRLYTNGSPDMVDDGQVVYRFAPADAIGRARLVSITDGSKVTSFYYALSGNGVGELERVVEESTGREARFTYDAQGRLLSVTSLDGVVTSFTYNTSGDISQVSSSWGTLTFSYDENHNITTVTDGLGGHSAHFAYAASARVIEFRNTSGSIYDFTYSTDGSDRVISTTFGLRGTAPTVYEFTADRLVASVVAPGTSKTCYTYNADKCLSGFNQCALTSECKVAQLSCAAAN